MDKFEHFNELLVFYQNLLTKRQQEIVKAYYFDDLSLSEIAENLNISRNGVHDALKKCEELLEHYENELNLNKNYKNRVELYQELINLNDDKVTQIVNKLLKTEEQI